VPGTVAYDGVSEGDSMMWADVPGDLARVVAYEGGGEVIEDHELEPCDSPVDCEVRCPGGLPGGVVEHRPQGLPGNVGADVARQTLRTVFDHATG